MAFTNEWNEAYPVGGPSPTGTSVRETDNCIRGFKVDIRERAGEEHITYADETGKTDVWKHVEGSAVIFVSALASPPSSPTLKEGRVWYQSDTGLLYVYYASAWNLAGATDHEDMTRYYDAGTVSIQIGSATLAGVNTLWAANISPGDQLQIDGDNDWYTVLSVGGDTAITLTTNYAGAAHAVGKAYLIGPFDAHPWYALASHNHTIVDGIDPSAHLHTGVGTNGAALTAATMNALPAASIPIAKVNGAIQMATGTFTGNGGAKTVTTGFHPKHVRWARGTDHENSWWDDTIYVHHDNFTYAEGAASFAHNDTSFTITSNEAGVNENNIAYVWIAWG